MRLFFLSFSVVAGFVMFASTAATAQTKTTCESFLGTDRSPSSLAALPAPGSTHRANLLLNGTSKLVVIGSRYYTVTIPTAFYLASKPVVILNLHGTGGYPEAEWTDWHASTTARGYAFISLAWGGGSPGADSDTQIYANLKQIITDVGASCPIGNARKWLMGFSVGSAYSFAVMIRDVADQKLFAGQIAISGSAIAPSASGKELMHPTVESNRSNTGAVRGIRSWMYCGANDFDHVWGMCTEMPFGQAFINEHGGRAVLYQDPTGTHHALPTNSAAYNQMFNFLVSSGSETTLSSYVLED